MPGKWNDPHLLSPSGRFTEPVGPRICSRIVPGRRAVTGPGQPCADEEHGLKLLPDFSAAMSSARDVLTEKVVVTTPAPKSGTISGGTGFKARTGSQGPRASFRRPFPHVRVVEAGPPATSLAGHPKSMKKGHSYAP